MFFTICNESNLRGFALCEILNINFFCYKLKHVAIRKFDSWNILVIGYYGFVCLNILILEIGNCWLLGPMLKTLRIFSTQSLLTNSSKPCVFFECEHIWMEEKRGSYLLAFSLTKQLQSLRLLDESEIFVKNKKIWKYTTKCVSNSCKTE